MEFNRDTENKIIAGVCAGIARQYHWEVWRVRIVFLVSIFFGGLGVALYLILWFLFPADKNIVDV